MSYHVFFAFSTGLVTTLSVPKGTRQRYVEHVEEVERALGLKRTKYLDNPIHWDRADFSAIDDKVLCETVGEHNTWVRECYANLAFWAEHPFTTSKGHQDSGPNRAWPRGWEAEQLTPEDAQAFWHGFALLTVPTDRWTREYYVARMEALYEVMRGREAEGVSFDNQALTPEQAAAVINLFSEYLDTHDMRLDVPRGHDSLASSYDGGYDWCENCGAVHPDDVGDCRKRKCPLREERGE